MSVLPSSHVVPPKATCSDWKGYGAGTSGVYIISPMGGCEFVVFCDMCLEQENDAWIVIQRRVDGTVPFHTKGWDDYKRGFGDYRYNYWMGLDKLHEITSSGNYELFVGLYDPLSSVSYRYIYVVYRTFAVASESQNYKLTVNYLDESRSSISELFESLTAHNQQEFTTFEPEHDNDGIGDRNCAHHGGLYYGGWWFGGSDCVDANLNGQYYMPGNVVVNNGIVWQGVSQHSMAATIMAIRRV